VWAKKVCQVRGPVIGDNQLLEVAAGPFVVIPDLWQGHCCLRVEQDIAEGFLDPA
jgi:hypothetical protein